MKKQLATLLATTALMGATSAFAANPLSDVGPTNWDYKAIHELQEAGLVTGYNTAALSAEQPISRMQMAMLVVDAIKHAPEADTQQKSVIVKLAREYKPELVAIGQKTGKSLDISKYLAVEHGSVQFRYQNGPVLTDVHKGTLNGMYDKVGPDVRDAIEQSTEAKAYLKIAEAKAKQLAAYKEQQAAKLETGTKEEQAEAQKLKKEATFLKNAGGKDLPIINDFNRQKKEQQFDTRLRVNVFGIFTPQTKALARVQADFKWGSEHTSQVFFDRLLIAQHIGKTDIVLGRQGVMVGDGLTYNDYFDGILASVKKGNTRLTAAYGWPSYYKSEYANGWEDPASMAYVLNAKAGKLRATLVQASTKIGPNVEAKVYFMKGNNGIPVSALGSAVSYKNKKFWAGGEYAALLHVNRLPQPYGLLSSLLDDTYAWTAGIGYGDFDAKKKGTWDVKLRYLFEGRVAPIMNPYTFNQPFINNYKAWNVVGNYALQNNLNVQLSAFLGGKSVKNTETYANAYSVSVNYSF